MTYRPITDVWLLARPKVRYYGAYPSGFLVRARALLGVQPENSVLHVCAGRVRDYPFGGLGPNDRTVDTDPETRPDWVMDVTKEMPPGPWPAILADPPYTEGDACHYKAATLPEPTALLRRCLTKVHVGARVGMLHYVFPRPPKTARLVACVGVVVGYANRMRCYSVFEREA